MIDFEVQRCTRRCAESDREFAPGEYYYSALVCAGADVQRLDYGESAWQGPPEKMIAWWKSQMPDAAAKKPSWAPNDVMLHYFEQLEGRPDKLDVRYVLALLMVRRRILRLEENETDDEGRETLVLFCPRNENEYRATAVVPDDRRAADIQNELAALLLGD